MRFSDLSCGCVKRCVELSIEDVMTKFRQDSLYGVFPGNLFDATEGKVGLGRETCVELQRRNHDLRRRPILHASGVFDAFGQGFGRGPRDGSGCLFWHDCRCRVYKLENLRYI